MAVPRLSFSRAALPFLAYEQRDLDIAGLSLSARWLPRSLEKFMAHLWQVHRISKLTLALSFFPTPISLASIPSLFLHCIFTFEAASDFLWNKVSVCGMCVYVDRWVEVGLQLFVWKVI